MKNVLFIVMLFLSHHVFSQLFLWDSEVLEKVNMGLRHFEEKLQDRKFKITKYPTNLFSSRFCFKESSCECGSFEYTSDINKEKKTGSVMVYYAGIGGRVNIFIFPLFVGENDSMHGMIMEDNKFYSHPEGQKEAFKYFCLD